MDQVPVSTTVTVDGDIHATNVIAGIPNNIIFIFPQPFTPPPDLKQLRHDYLAYLSLAIVPGNRVVVTSRIVGYDTTPLRGPQWRTYTLNGYSALPSKDR